MKHTTIPLARFGKKIRKGIRVEQGQVIGYVGVLQQVLTSISRCAEEAGPLIPAGQKILHGEPVPAAVLTEFSRLRDVFKRFREEGVEIPFPHRTVCLRQERV